MEVMESYDQEGIERDKGTLKNGNGTQIKYNDDGTVEKTRTYKNGVKVQTEKN